MKYCVGFGTSIGYRSQDLLMLGMKGVRERREMWILGFLAQTVEWMVVPITERGRLGEK